MPDRDPVRTAPEWKPTAEEVRAILDELRPLLRGEEARPRGDAWRRD